MSLPNCKRAVFSAVGETLLSIVVVASSAQAATLDFDLTNYVGPDFATYPDAVVNLGVEFSQVDSATLHLEGVFTPGLMTAATVPPDTGPLIPTDTVNLLIRLGEVGTAWIDKDAYAIQELRGYDGAVEFDLPLLGVESSELVLTPSGTMAPDFGFLLDGRFGLSTGWTHMVASLYRVVVNPKFEASSLVLRINGVAVPEPSSCVLLLSLAMGACLSRRSRKDNAGVRGA